MIERNTMTRILQFVLRILAKLMKTRTIKKSSSTHLKTSLIITDKMGLSLYNVADATITSSICYSVQLGVRSTKVPATPIHSSDLVARTPISISGNDYLIM